MALITCHECKKDISDQADKCPYCGAKPTFSGKASALRITAAVAGTIFLLSFCMRSSPPTPPEPASQESSAINACRDFIEKSLHDPDSAKFDTTSKAVTTQKGETWTVMRGVRAKNGFGALRHNIFICKMRFVNNDWQAISISEINQ